MSTDKVQCVGIVFGSFLFHLIIMGLSLSFGIVYSELHTEFDVSQSQAAWAASLFVGLVGVAGAPVSWCVTRYGERRVAVMGSLLLSAGMLTSYFVHSFNLFFLTYGVLGGLGASACMLPAVTILMKTFDRNRALFIAICTSGSAIGSLGLPPFLSYMIMEYGWRGTFLLLCGLALQCLPASLMFISHNAVKHQEEETDQQLSFMVCTVQIIRNRTFLLFATSAILCFMVIFGPATFLPDLMKEVSLSDQQIYIVLMVMGGGHLIGRLSPGVLERVLNLDLMNMYCCVLLLGTATACLFYVANVFVAFLVLGWLIGIVSGAFLCVHASLVAQFLDKKYSDVGFGWICTLEGTVVVGGLPFTGFIIDQTSTLRSGFLFTGGVLFLSLTMAIVTKISVLRSVKLKEPLT